MPATLVSALRDVLALSVLFVVAAAGTPAYGAGPPSTSPPTIGGTVEVGETLTVSTGAWAVQYPLQYAYQWQRCAGTPYAPEVLRDAPTSYYRLGDEAGSAGVTDATGNENAGVFRNGVLQEVDGGPFEDTDGAAGFDGVDDLVEIPDAAGLDLGDSLTLEAWVRPAGLRPAQLFDKGPNGYALRIAGDGAIVLSKSGAGTIAASSAAVPQDGSFHHVVATKSGASTRLYLDGADVTGAVSNRTVADTGSPLRLGAAHSAPAGEGPFAGELDEVALYRGALSAAQARAHYDAGSSGCVSVPGAAQASYMLVAADYGADVRALVTASDASGATTVASGTLPVGTRVPVSVDPPVVWGEAVAGEELRAGEGTWAGDEPLQHSFQWQGCVDRRYRATVLADGPNGYWRLGELSGTTAADHAGKGNKGTYVNGVKLGVPGALLRSGDGNRAARLDGVNDFVTVPDRSSLDLGDSLTIEGWARRNASGVRGQVVQKGGGGYALRVNADGRVHFAKSDVGDLAVSTMTIPVDGAFRHVVATKNGATIRIYVDGEDVTSVVANRTLVNTSAPLQIGRLYNPATGAAANYFGGDLDEVAVYDHALSAARVRAHYEMGTSGCTNLPGATAASYTPGDAQAGQRLRVVVTARNGAGWATAVSEQTQAPVSQGGEPVIASGTLTDASGNPVAGAPVALYLWPSAVGDLLVPNDRADTPLVAETTTDAGGEYALRAPVTPEIQAEADLNGGVVNFEVRASANGLLYETFVGRDFGSPGADSLALGGDALAGAAAVWQDGNTALPAAPLRIALAADEPAVTALAADPQSQGVECSDWDKTFRIWKRTGQGEAWTRVGELHTWSTMTNRFAYGTRADSTIEIAFKKPTSKWFVNGSVHVGNSTGQTTAAEVQATTGVGEYTSRAVRARFVYTHWYQCGTGNKKSRAARWNGYSLGKGVRVSTRDGECSELKAWIFEPGQAWERNRNRAVHWGVAVDLGFFMVGARSGYSTWVRSKWFFGSTLASRTLCGVNKYPGDAPRVFAGW